MKPIQQVVLGKLNFNISQALCTKILDSEVRVVPDHEPLSRAALVGKGQEQILI